MDPLIIGFEQALHEANRAASPDSTVVARLAAALERVIFASPHRVRHAVSVAVIDATRIEVRRGTHARSLVNELGGWQWEGSSDQPWSGVVALALTEWLTS